MGNRNDSQLQEPAEPVTQCTVETLQSIASPTVSSDKVAVKKLQAQIEEMELLKADNKKGHNERMDALAKSNLEKRGARHAQYDAESEAQRHRNADSKASNVKKVSDLSSANESKMTAQRNCNKSEVIEMRRKKGQRDDEHTARMIRMRAQNKAQMAALTESGALKLSEAKQRGCADKLRHDKEFAENEATHDADMAAIEQKHQTDLGEALHRRDDNLMRHNLEMAGMGLQHKFETDEMELRQRNEVEALSVANEDKAATQATNMEALKGRNQTSMDEMCRRMKQIDALETQIEDSTQRFFVLAEKVEEERETMRRYEELKRMTEESLATQMKHIECVHEEIEKSQRKAEKVTCEGSLKELYKEYEMLVAERKKTRRRMSRQIDAFEEVNKKLLEKYNRILDGRG